MKKFTALLLCAVLLMTPLCGCKKGEGKYLTQTKPGTVSQDLSPTTLTFTNVTAKAGEEIEVKLSANTPSTLFGFSWEINYDSSVMKPVDIVESEELKANFNIEHNKTNNPLTLQGDGKEIKKGNVSFETFLF